jgi:AcrR family transcriptional regulator
LLSGTHGVKHLAMVNPGGACGLAPSCHVARAAAGAKLLCAEPPIGLFSEHGFAGASTLEIATRAQVSKRDLYGLFDSKQAMRAASITERAGQMRQPLNLASQVAPSREALEATLVQFGKSILLGLSAPHVLAVYRLAIAESARAPDSARTVDKAGREANHLAPGAGLAKALARGAHRWRQSGRDGGPLPGHSRGRVADLAAVASARWPTAGEIESRARIASESLDLALPAASPERTSHG